MGACCPGTEGTQDVVSPIMAAAKAKVQVLDVQETQEKLAEAKVIVAKETTKLAGDKVKLESSQVAVAAEQKIFDRKAAKVKKGEGSSASLKGPASKLATAKSSMIKLQSTVNSVQQKIDDASSIVTVDKKTVLRTKKVTASKSFSQLKADIMDEATKAAEVATAAQAANHLKKLTAAQADRDFNLKHTQAIATAQKASVRADQRSQQGIDIAKNEVESTKDREKRAAAKAKKLQVRARAANFGAAIGQRDELVAQQEKKEALKAEKDKQEAKEKATVNKARGLAAIKEAKEMLDDNKLRIAETLTAVQKAEINLKNEREKERLDKKKVAITSAATQTLELQTSKLEKKRDAVHAFGATLKERAERDANAAKAGLAKAKDDLSSAKAMFGSFTKRANNYQGKISKSAEQKKNRDSAKGSAKTEAATALAGATDAVKRSNKKHKASLEGLSATQLEVANAKQAYSKAFGKQAAIPGQAEDAAIKSAKSVTSKAISNAAGALAANGVN